MQVTKYAKMTFVILILVEVLGMAIIRKHMNCVGDVLTCQLGKADVGCCVTSVLLCRQQAQVYFNYTVL